MYGARLRGFDRERLAAYRYAVAAYTAEGGESPLSLEVRVGGRPLRVYLPYVGRGAQRQ